jgi:hypothetical protein
LRTTAELSTPRPLPSMHPMHGRTHISMHAHLTNKSSQVPAKLFPFAPAKKIKNYLIFLKITFIIATV